MGIHDGSSTAYRSGQHLFALVDVLHKMPTARVRINGVISDLLVISRGTRQGCPLSPLLYTMVAEPLMCALREYHAHRGIRFPKYLIVSAYADDSLLYVRDPAVNLAPMLREVVAFGEHSGSHFIWTKSLMHMQQFPMEFALQWT